jgi:hypothetical protein
VDFLQGQEKLKTVVVVSTFLVVFNIFWGIASYVKMKPKVSTVPLKIAQIQVNKLSDGQAGWLSYNDIGVDDSGYCYANAFAVTQPTPSAKFPVKISYRNGQGITVILYEPKKLQKVDGKSKDAYLVNQLIVSKEKVKFLIPTKDSSSVSQETNASEPLSGKVAVRANFPEEFQMRNPETLKEGESRWIDVQDIYIDSNNEAWVKKDANLNNWSDKKHELELLRTHAGIKIKFLLYQETWQFPVSDDPPKKNEYIKVNELEFIREKPEDK